MEISPVLQAFLSGQQQQTDVITKAKEALDRQQQAKERRAQLDEIIRQHNLENNRATREFDLQQQIASLTRQKAMDDHAKGLADQLRSGEIPPQMTPATGNIQIPGMQLPQANVSDPVVAGPSPAVNIPGVPIPQNVAPVQHFEHPVYGPIDVPMPMTDIQHAQAMLPITRAAEQDKADVAVNQAKRIYDEVNSTRDAEKAATALEREKDRSAAISRDADRRVEAAQLASQLRMLQHESDLTGGLTADAVNSKVKEIIPHALIGNYDISKEPYPKVREALRNGVFETGGNPDIPAKTYTDIYQKGSTAQDIHNTIAAFNDLVAAPHKLTDRIAGAITGGVGYKGLGVDKQTFDEFTAKVVPQIEIASGMTPGSMRNTTMLDMFKKIVRQPGDSAKNIAIKAQLADGIPIAAAAKDISAFPARQQPFLWAEFVKRNPGITKLNPDIVQNILDAAKPGGSFEPGAALREFLKNAKP